MKIIVILRTRDSELFIERFCRSYTWADKILIADGGSEDRTVELANQFNNVSVCAFTERVYRKGYWRNPHGKHINFLIDWAEREDADWIIFDDVDCVPNYAIKNDYLDIFQTEKDFILVNRVYIYQEDYYFERLTSPIIKDKIHTFAPSLWAWRANKGFRASEADPFRHRFNTDFSVLPLLELHPPHCLLHYFYPNDEYMHKKIDFYAHIRELAEDVPVRDPKEYGGSLLKLEEWMHE